MDNQTLKSFNTELQKTALAPRFVTKLMGNLGILRAGVKGDKVYLRQAAREAKKLKTLDPTLDGIAARDEIFAKLKEQGAAKAKASMDGAKDVRGPSWVGKHKKKLIVGGAAGAGLLYLANKNSPEEELQQQQIAAYQ